MLEQAEFDTTDQGTLRPKAPSFTKKGDHFDPIEISNFEFDIMLPDIAFLDDPIILFTLYYNPEMISIIVFNTNSYVRKPKDPEKPWCRANKWYPTCDSEIYVYFAFHIYITIYPINEIANYWKISKLSPYHSIICYISRDKFQKLHMRYRVAL